MVSRTAKLASELQYTVQASVYGNAAYIYDTLSQQLRNAANDRRWKLRVHVLKDAASGDYAVTVDAVLANTDCNAASMKILVDMLREDGLRVDIEEAKCRRYQRVATRSGYEWRNIDHDNGYIITVSWRKNCVGACTIL